MNTQSNDTVRAEDSNDGIRNERIRNERIRNERIRNERIRNKQPSNNTYWVDEDSNDGIGPSS